MPLFVLAELRLGFSRANLNELLDELVRVSIVIAPDAATVDPLRDYTKCDATRENDSGETGGAGGVESRHLDRRAMSSARPAFAYQR
jgi:hypothetical protein